jgi:hypothetical protein
MILMVAGVSFSLSIGAEFSRRFGPWSPSRQRRERVDSRLIGTLTTDAGDDTAARRLVPTNRTDLNLASTTSTLVAARRAPMAHDVFDDFKKLLIGGWEE